MLVSVVGCSKDYRVRLYNFYGTPIQVAGPATSTIDSTKSALMYDSTTGENVLLSGVVKIRFGDDISCYFLEKIKVGGYAQYDDSGDLIVRLKLDEDKKIYVYDVRAGFNKKSGVGVQPEHYR